MDCIVIESVLRVGRGEITAGTRKQTNGARPELGKIRENENESTNGNEDTNCG